MERFLICSNPKCHFVLDRRINGKSLDGAQLILKRCPARGGEWSSTCLSCTQALAVKFMDGLPHSVYWDRKPPANARAA